MRRSLVGGCLPKIRRCSYWRKARESRRAVPRNGCRSGPTEARRFSGGSFRSAVASSGTRVSNLRKIHTGVGSSLGDTSMKIGTPTFPRVCTELDPVAKVTKRCWICQELKNIAKFLILTPKGSTWPYSMCVLVHRQRSKRHRICFC